MNDVLALIGNEHSIPILIDVHRNFSGEVEGSAISTALRSIGSEAGYLYLSEIITRYVDGDLKVVNSRNELYVACLALGEWQDTRAVKPLQMAMKIEFLNVMPHGAIEALARYDEGKTYLENIKDELPEYSELISSMLENAR